MEERRTWSWTYMIIHGTVSLATSVLVLGVLWLGVLRFSSPWQTALLAFGLVLVQTVVTIRAGMYLNRRSVRRYHLLGALQKKVNQAILLDSDPTRIYNLILDAVMRIYPFVRYGSILVLDDAGVLRMVADRGFEKDFVRDFELKPEDGFLYLQTAGAMDKTVRVAPRILRSAAALVEPENINFRDIIIAPLWRDGTFIGQLNLDSSRSNAFDHDDVRLVDLIRGQIEVALHIRDRHEAKIGELSQDALTGLPTRRFFQEMAIHSLDRALRYGEHFVLCLFDLDKLKQVNDRFGHQAGDLLIQEFARRLQSSHRKSDLVGRLGGDEFVAIYHEADKETMAASVGTLAQLCAAQPLRFEGVEWRLGFFWGLAAFPHDGTDLESLMQHADKALYAMKATHRS